MEIERNHMLKILAMTDWSIRGKAGAPELLGLKPATLHSRMKKLGISRETWRRYFVYQTIFRLKCSIPEFPVFVPCQNKPNISMWLRVFPAFLLPWHESRNPFD